jgi:hypothetical protein
VRHVRRGSIALGERASFAEELAQAVGDGIDVLAERAGCHGVVEVADEVGRECGVVEEFLEGGTVNADAHAPSIQR